MLPPLHLIREEFPTGRWSYSANRKQGVDDQRCQCRQCADTEKWDHKSQNGKRWNCLNDSCDLQNRLCAGFFLESRIPSGMEMNMAARSALKEICTCCVSARSQSWIRPVKTVKDYSKPSHPLLKNRATKSFSGRLLISSGVPVWMISPWFIMHRRSPR